MSTAERVRAFDPDAMLGDPDMLRMMLDNIVDGVYFTDLKRTIQYWNRGAERISGYASREVAGRSCKDNILMHVDMAGNCVCTSNTCPLLKCFRGESDHVERLYLKHKAGHRVPVRVCSSPLRDKNGDIIGGLETFHDITNEVAALQEVDTLKEAALLCPLTGVGNRRYCEQALANQLRELLPGPRSVGLLFLDVDKFKSYNDRYGHEVGDVVLKIVARTLSRDLRAFDFVGRWGGEEFLVILPRMNKNDLEDTANRLRVLVESSSSETSQGKLTVTVSMGATLAAPGETPEAVVARADKLMYASKQDGRNRVTVG